MNTSSDAAEQLVRISLNTVEVAAKITGSGAKNVAVMLYAIMKDQKQTKGKTRLNNMLKSGQPLKIYAVRDEDLQKFCTEAKKYGVLYCVLKDKNAEDGMTDIMVREFDSAKINRIFDRFNLANVDMASIKTEIEKSREEKVVDKSEEFLDKLLSAESQKEDKQNSQTARTVNPNLSEHSSTTPKNRESAPSTKQSVRQKLNEFKAQQKKPNTKPKTRNKSKSKKKGKSR